MYYTYNTYSSVPYRRFATLLPTNFTGGWTIPDRREVPICSSLLIRLVFSSTIVFSQARQLDQWLHFGWILFAAYICMAAYQPVRCATWGGGERGDTTTASWMVDVVRPAGSDCWIPSIQPFSRLSVQGENVISILFGENGRDCFAFSNLDDGERRAPGTTFSLRSAQALHSFLRLFLPTSLPRLPSLLSYVSPASSCLSTGRTLLCAARRKFWRGGTRLTHHATTGPVATHAHTAARRTLPLPAHAARRLHARLRTHTHTRAPPACAHTATTPATPRMPHACTLYTACCAHAYTPAHAHTHFTTHALPATAAPAAHTPRAHAARLLPLPHHCTHCCRARTHTAMRTHALPFLSVLNTITDTGTLTFTRRTLLRLCMSFWWLVEGVALLKHDTWFGRTCMRWVGWWSLVG